MQVKQLVAGVFITGVVTAGVLTALAAPPQLSSRRTINVDDARPLLEVVDALEKEYGVPINYEDPPYHRTEGIDVTAVRSHGKPVPPGQREIIPRPGPFSFEYRLPAGPRGDALAHVLAELVRQFHASGRGQFRVDRNGDAFTVVPITKRVRRGVDEPYQALLDTELRFTPSGRERSVYEALNDWGDALQRAAGVPVDTGVQIARLLQETVAPDLTGTMPARTALAQLLGGTRVPLSWALLTGPTEPRKWWLNLKVVRQD
jgi:hypothetical protein